MTTRIVIKYVPGKGNMIVELPITKEMKDPSHKTMMKWIEEGRAKATDGCWVEPDGRCEHGHASWLLELGIS